MHGDKELVHPAALPPSSSYLGASSFSQPFSSQDYTDIHVTLQSIEEKQVSLWAYVWYEHAAFRDFVQEWYDELREMITSQN